MKACVVDASVVAAAFFQEEYSAQARALLLSDRDLLAPDLVYPEYANAMWKRHRRGEINEAEAGELFADVRRLPLRLTPSNELLDSALDLAIRTNRTVYDCVYLALALDRTCPLITADRRLVNALTRTPLANKVRWIGQGR